MERPDRAKKAVIDKFLADNPELEELSAKLATFNAFRVLRIENAEIRHSNVLAWLLNPKESHGLGDIVLKRVLSNILLQADKNIKGVSAAKVELMNFVDIEIRREWRNIDLLVIDRTNKLAILIENKVHSNESPGQLAKYQQAINDEFPSLITVPVFLTITGQESAEVKGGNYIPYSYLQLLAVLQRLFAQRQSQLAEPVTIFIKQYMDILRRLTMQDESLVRLCKTIYRRHREAIDSIVEYGRVSVGQQAVEDIFSEEKNYETLYSCATSVYFLPKAWSKIIPANSVMYKHLTRWVSIICFFEFQISKNRIRLIFEVSAMKDVDLRLACVKDLSKAGFKLGEKAFLKEAKYSRFFSQSLKVSDINDYKDVRKTVENLLKRAKAEFPKAEAVFREVFKNIRSKG